MASDNTYLKLFRKMLTWEWYKDANTMRVFIHILLKVNYKPSKYRGVDVPAGSCVFGYKACADDLKLSVQQVRTAIKHLKSTGEITMYSTSKFSIVSLAKWGFWQIDEGELTSKITRNVTPKQQATNKQVTTSKESKNVKKEKYYYSEPKKTAFVDSGVMALSDEQLKILRGE